MSVNCHVKTSVVLVCSQSTEACELSAVLTAATKKSKAVLQMIFTQIEDMLKVMPVRISLHHRACSTHNSA